MILTLKTVSETNVENMKNTVLMIRPGLKWETPEKIAYQYMNRIAINENTAFEIKAVIKSEKKQGLVTVHNPYLKT